MKWFNKLLQSDPVASPEFKKKIDRYSISDEEIEDLVFETSTKQLCFLVDQVVQKFYPFSSGQEESDKALSIAAYGVSHNYLSQKQKKFLAAFIIYYSKDKLTRCQLIGKTLTDSKREYLDKVYPSLFDKDSQLGKYLRMDEEERTIAYERLLYENEELKMEK